MLKRFIAISIVIHVIIILIMAYAITDKEKKKLFQEEKPLIARIITPEKEKPKEAARELKESPSSLSVPPSSALKGKTATKAAPPPQAAKKGGGRPPSGPRVYRDRGIEQEKNIAPPMKDAPQLNVPPVPSMQAGEGQKPQPKIPPSMGSLFDKEIIAKHGAEQAGEEKEYRHKPGENKKNNALSFDVDDMQYYTYMKRLKESIESVWSYPQSEARKGIYGDLFIEFTIKKNGVLSEVRILRTSGHTGLDDSAVQSIKDASPFWPLPEDWGKESFTVKGHFVYTLWGQAIR